MPALGLPEDEEARLRALREMAEGLEASPVPVGEMSAPSAPIRAPRVPIVAGGTTQMADAAADPYGDALAAARKNTLALELARMGSGINEAITGAKAPEGLYDRLGAQAQEPVVEYLQRQKLADEKRRLDLTAQKASPKPGTELSPDPASPASRRAQALVEAVVPGMFTPEQLALIPETEADAIRQDALASQRIETTREGQTGMNTRAGKALTLRERLAGQAAEAAKTRQAELRVTGLRKEFMGSPVVREYEQARIGLEKVERAAIDPTAAGDLALIFGYMKTLDPTSAVKETEFANAENAKGIPDAVRAKWNKALSGERLTPAQRKEFIASARTQFKAYETAFSKMKTYYDDLAGADSGRVTIQGGHLDLGGGSAPQSQNVVDKRTMEDGTEFVKYSDGRWVERKPAAKE